MLDSQTLEEECNPIDGLEEILNNYNWTFKRLNDEEIYLTLTGRENDYNVNFIWDEVTHMLQICCKYDVDVNARNLASLQGLIADINESLYLGHFYLDRQSNQPTFRYTAMMKGITQSQAETMANEIFEMCLSQCERCSSAFSILSQDQQANADMLSFALMETQGQS